jgi:hypothetical protein
MGDAVEFVSFVFPESKKVFHVTSSGLHEYLHVGKPLAGVWLFKTLPDLIHAVPIRPAETHEKTELFNTLKLPQVGVLPVLKTSNWFCLPLNFGQYQKYVKTKTPLPLLFTPETVSLFDPLLARVYKHRRTVLIYEDVNERYPTEQVEKLRQGLETWRKMGVCNVTGIPRELHNALKLAVESEAPPLERLVKHCLRLAEAQFRSLTDLGNGQYRVNYVYRGHSDSVVIDDNLTVLESGICLSGRNHDFDLSSVILVKARAPSFARR